MATTKRRTQELLEGFLGGRSPHTAVAYMGDLERFVLFFSQRLGKVAHGLDRRPNPHHAESLDGDAVARLSGPLSAFLNSDPGRANEIVFRYRSELIQSGAAPGTVNRRLNCLRSFVKWARMAGECPWTIEVNGIRHELSRDTRGPSLEVVNQMLDVAAKRKPPIGPRDVALIRVLFDLALRIGEVVKLDLLDVQLEADGGPCLWVLGKGKRRKALLHMPEPTCHALRAWIDVRGRKPGPVFLSCGRNPANKDTRRLLTRSIWKIIHGYGVQCGVHVRPHGLRHASITAAVEAATKAGLSLDVVQSFSRHAKIETLLVYRDRMTNHQGELAGLVAQRLGGSAG